MGVFATIMTEQAAEAQKTGIETGISPCIPSRTGRKTSIPHDTGLYRLHHRIENMFARLKDWRRIGTRYDRCPILSLSACALAANVI